MCQNTFCGLKSGCWELSEGQTLDPSTVCPAAPIDEDQEDRQQYGPTYATRQQQIQRRLRELQAAKVLPIRVPP